MNKALSDKSSYHRVARKVWEKAHGERPFDVLNKRFEVHHIDGDYTNNSTENLLCISPTTHRAIHNGKNYMINIDDLNHVRNNTTPDFIAIEELRELVTALVETMEDLGTELTEDNGGREGWEDLVNYSDDALDNEEEYDLTGNRAYSFIWRVAYPIALSDMKSK
jgi:hypothetical protein